MSETSSSGASKAVLDRISEFEFRVNLQTAFIVLIVLLAIITRFYDLESRVMSHDESLHTYYSWRLKEFQDYRHTPLMHGPLQFHLIAFSYFLFGDSDASARFPAAVFGVASILLLLIFRKWLGKWGTYAAMLLMVVSPYMLYYQRYVRNEAIVVFLGLLMFWSVFEYFRNRHPRWLLLLAITLSLHHATKETSFIYVAQLLLFLGVYLAWNLLRRMWSHELRRWAFLIGLGFTILGILVASAGLLTAPDAGESSEAATVIPLDPTASDILSGVRTLDPTTTVGFFFTIFGLLIVTLITVWTFGNSLKTDFPSLDLLIIAGTLTLPLLAAFPARLLGFEPFDGQSSVFNTPTGLVVLILLVISVLIGVWWGWRRWAVPALAFFGIFILLYTTFFTNGDGLSSGLVRSLEYWLVQHGVKRGGQPFYYYLFIQIPIYEYLPAIGTLIAGFIGVRSVLGKIVARRTVTAEENVDDQGIDEPKVLSEGPVGVFPVILFLFYWAITSLGAYSLAGEKMPWLSVHIVLPMILLSGWGVEKLLQSSNLVSVRTSKSWLAVILLILFGYGFLKSMGAVFGPEPPFKGNELISLRATSLFIGSMAITIGSFIGLLTIFQNLSLRSLGHFVRLAFLGLLLILTTRTAFRAAYLHGDLAIEYLVYAHAGPGIKTVLSQIEAFSQRTTGGLAVDVAYDNDVSWPYSWYFRNYSNTHYYADNPTRELLDYPLILAGNDNWSEVEKIIGNRYISSEFIRMWWPNQDYIKLSPDSIEAERRNQILLEDGSDPSKMGAFEYLGRVIDKIQPFFADPEIRKAVWQIWLNRDFSYHAALTGRDLSLENWSPSDRMRFYIRRDVAEYLWDYGIAGPGAFDVPIQDPYEGRLILLDAELIVENLDDPVQLNSPRDLAVAPDGSIYVADSGNHRIVHLSAEGSLLHQWGSFAQTSDSGFAPPGSFSEPWGIAVAPDGDVYVADTWNHRVQVFSPDGEYLHAIGPLNEAGESMFWGPRAVTFDQAGRLYVSDTGNHRILIFSEDGQRLGEFGGEGYDFGQLREPVGLGIDEEGLAYVADTWNHRVEVFEEIGENDFFFLREWSIEGWYGESLVNKPYLATSPEGHVCLSDPEGNRILCFSSEGQYIIGWGQFGETSSSFGLVNGIAFTEEEKLWVVDAGNSRIMLFDPPLP